MPRASYQRRPGCTAPARGVCAGADRRYHEPMPVATADRLHFTGDAEADRLLVEEPLALLIGFALDQQVPVQKAFSGPMELRRRIGHLDAARIAAMDPADLDAAFRERPAPALGRGRAHAPDAGRRRLTRGAGALSGAETSPQGRAARGRCREGLSRTIRRPCEPSRSPRPGSDAPTPGRRAGQASGRPPAPGSRSGRAP